MTVHKLSTISFDELIDCFLVAFQNYFIKMPEERSYYKERWEAANVDLNLSYGMFDQGKLIGFIIHAIDNRFGILTAFNTGTGVIPAYRGKRVVKSIYEYALHDLKQNGIEKSTLEVITKNEIAIRSYKSIGFNICKKYKCYSGTLKTKDNNDFDLKEIQLKQVNWDTLPNQEFYSWDNQKETILKGNYQFFQVLVNNTAESYFIIRPEKNYIAQFDLLNSKNKGWDRLFSAMKQISDTVKINNVDNRLIEKNKNLISKGLKNPIDQFEMELNLLL